ncbi:MAG: ATP-binding cassette domain-containing protein [Bryobacteraceae bacterium]|nr:ATP-binding cassette domain-containing protein [Bryobacteraceae bacterium]
MDSKSSRSPLVARWGEENLGALVYRVLEFSSASVGMELDEEAARAAIQLAIREADGTQSVLDLFCRAGEELGIVFARVNKSVDNVMKIASPRSAWLTIVQEQGEVAGVLGVRDADGRRVEVSMLDSDAAPKWVSVSELTRLLGAGTKRDQLEWVAVEAAAPLSQYHHSAGHDDHVYHNVPPFERIKTLLKAEKTDLWVAVIYSAAIGLMTLVVPVATQSLVNTVAFGTLLQPLVVLTLAVLAGLGFAALLQGLRTYVVEIIQRRIFVRVATDVAHRLLRAKTDGFEGHHAPELVNRFLDVATVQKAAAMLLIDGLSIFMQTIIGMILLAIYHPWLLAFDVLMLLFILIVLFPMGSGAIATAIKESKAKYALTAWLEEMARHPLTFKSSRGAALALEQANTLAAEWLRYRSKHFRILLRQIIGSFALQAIASSVLLGVGGWLVINRQLTLGQLIAAELVVALVVSGFTKFGKQLETFYDLSAAIDKLGYLTDLPLEKQGAVSLRRTEHPASVLFRNVQFTYDGRTSILNGLNWEIKPGARIGLIGNSGSGKSSLLDMLFGLRFPGAGILEIDDVDIREVNLRDLRAQVALCRSDDVFDGTIADNIRLGHGTLGSSDIRGVLQKVGLLSVVQSLPDGINTQLSTGGWPLSAGQVARLTLARAIAGKPRLLILDECLESLVDARDREQIIDAIFDRRAPWTLIVVSADEGVLGRCDRVYELRGGTIEEASTAVTR